MPLTLMTIPYRVSVSLHHRVHHFHLELFGDGLRNTCVQIEVQEKRDEHHQRRDSSTRVVVVGHAASLGIPRDHDRFGDNNPTHSNEVAMILNDPLIVN